MTKKPIKGKIGIRYLDKIWESIKLEKEGRGTLETRLEVNYLHAVFDALGVGLEPTIQYLFREGTSFDEFENWIIANAAISNDMIRLVNSAFTSLGKEDHYIMSEDDPITEDMMLHWEEEGYLIIPQAISKEDCTATVAVIEEYLKIDLSDPVSWYQNHPAKKGIMVQLFHHPQLEKNRFSTIIQRAYKQLWNRNDLIVSKDRVSFNPPETSSYSFPGPDLHWDVSIRQPSPFGLQGLLYLTDTPANQGAFTIVPGFHKKIGSWLQNLPPDVNPRNMNLHALGTKSIAANAGDFIIWNHLLPHGSSPNTGTHPRIVQYINYQPINREINPIWI